MARKYRNDKFQFANMPFERGEILFSKGFFVYTDIRKLQDKAKTSLTISHTANLTVEKVTISQYNILKSE